MPDNRGSPPSANSLFHYYSGRLYRTDGQCDSVHVLVNACGRTPYPYVEKHFSFTKTQRCLHDIDASLVRRLPSGDFVTVKKFRCFFRRHKKLPLNPGLKIRGELMIMSLKDNGSVGPWSSSDVELADRVAQELTPALRRFQRSGTPVSPLNIELTEIQTQLRSLEGLYYGIDNASWVSVPTVFTAAPSTFPCLEHLFVSSNKQKWIHATSASIEHRLPSGEVSTTKFMCFYQRHAGLPLNKTLDVKGEILVVRAESDGALLTDMDRSEAHLADQVIARLAPAVKLFQGPRRVLVKPVVITLTKC
ncbi:hypothetical protein R3P38DRAFT_3175010 [Favolaschia claudopus]|uniref:Uncharacterized protein n=1 Tax=Favolaschia claudopus TaxID=2862362 RepID=A0AAW0DBM6_9AGAR